jgi:hypothetical protein
MNEIALANRAADGRRLKALVLDSVSSPITKRVYNLGLDEFFAWYGQEPRPGSTKATVSAWRVALEARGLGSVSINVRITAVRKLAVEAADNGLLAPELAAGITRVKGAKSFGLSPPLSTRLSRQLRWPPPTPPAPGVAAPVHQQDRPFATSSRVLDQPTFSFRLGPADIGTAVAVLLCADFLSGWRNTPPWPRRWPPLAFPWHSLRLGHGSPHFGGRSPREGKKDNSGIRRTQRW